MKRLLGAGFLISLFFLFAGAAATGDRVQAQSYHEHLVQPGDTWTALQWRYDLPPGYLQALNPHPNKMRQPVIGRTLFVPADASPQQGALVPTTAETTLSLALRHGRSPWAVALGNGLPSPYLPTLDAPLFLPQEGAAPRILPGKMDSLEVSAPVGRPGQAVGVRGLVENDAIVTAWLDGRPLDTWQEGEYWVALTGTGAFYGTAQPELVITSDGEFWSQPWQFEDLSLWDFQEITLTGSAAQIDQASIAAERERLFAIWDIATPGVQWQASFQLPVDDYLTISSEFGARRSYNGGPYASYHEGVDFAAYGGTPVYAPARGTIIIAELLYVRGGTVIIDHGFGVYSGYYHLSAVHVSPGEIIDAGHLLGEVGTSGLSTGNHLHWDLLVNATWVDAWAWYEQDMGCWILHGLGQACTQTPITSDPTSP